ncbi:MAG: ABC transporter substrate-binding protein, partial [Myxococcota bacterium]|nr:ABC transporter substrate-binding protein [Myxococcota bacterium]
MRLLSRKSRPARSWCWILVLLTCCAPDTGGTFGLSRSEQPDDVLVFNNATEPEYLDPGQATGHPDGRIIGELFDGLTDYHPEDLSAVPGAASSWDTHPDGRGYTFHLRPEAQWTDGAPLTAHDFAWSWERVLNPVFLARYAQQIYA